MILPRLLANARRIISGRTVEAERAAEARTLSPLPEVHVESPSRYPAEPTGFFILTDDETQAVRRWLDGWRSVEDERTIRGICDRHELLWQKELSQ